ncbi:MAG: IS3 family transposase [bacterium]|nr:IS3 family transposase [bacterium]
MESVFPILQNLFFSLQLASFYGGKSMPRRRPMVKSLQSGYGISERHACRLLVIRRSTYRSQAHLRDDRALRLRIKELSETYVRYGYRRLHILLLREGWRINHKVVHRIYREEGLSLRLKTRKKRGNQPKLPLTTPNRPNECWTMDFMSDRLEDGRRFCLPLSGGCA